jgi:hypothetical protein
VTNTRLWYSEIQQSNESVAYEVAGLAKTLLRTVENAGRILHYAGDVLDHQTPWLKNLSSANHREIELVLGVIPASMIVQIRMALARRSAHKNVHGAYLFFRRAFRVRAFRAELTVEPREHVAAVVCDHGREVLVVDVADLFADLHGKYDLEPAAVISTRLCNTKRQAPAPRKEIDNTNRIFTAEV